MIAIAIGDGEGPSGTDVEAHAHAVAEDLPHKDGFAFVIEFQGSLVTCGRAETATVAEVAIDLDDLPGAHFHSCSRDVPGTAVRSPIAGRIVPEIIALMAGSETRALDYRSAVVV